MTLAHGAPQYFSVCRPTLKVSVEVSFARVRWSAVPRKSTAWPPVFSPSDGEKRKGGSGYRDEFEGRLRSCDREA